MKVILALDSFKGSLDACSAVHAVERGFKRICPDIEVVSCPVADGGEGTVRILTEAARGELRTVKVHGPLMEPVEATWGLLGDNTAIIEMAEAAGLILLDENQRDPTRTTSYGLGELMLHALDSGADSLIIGLGGSATVDGGTGMAQALGTRFPGLEPPMTGGKLAGIRSVDTSRVDERIGDVVIRVALDVKNPLLGPKGAAAVFGPQKGATAVQVAQLERGLAHLSTFFPDVSPDLPGAGAAGGLGWGLPAFTGAELKSGIDLCLDTLDFEGLLRDAQLVITGEGSFDEQTLSGKVPLGVAQRARAKHIPTIVLAGDFTASLGDLSQYGIVGYYSVVSYFSVSIEESMARASVLLEDLAARVCENYMGSK